VSPDVTFNIYVGPEGAATSRGMVSSQSAAATEVPTPLPLEQLQVSSAQFAPAPLSPQELSTVQTGGVAMGTPPAPMPVERLRATTATTLPKPQPLGSLQGVGSVPTPRPLDALGAAGGSGATPGPLAPEQLGKGTQPPEASSSEKPSRGRKS
jgi:hypothetical protein